ncbi:MAG TPA: hypothetical protein VM032_00195 [Vicinamibacterales bacterium]|nr:hypothetical protein [Vicinamibacterales bacterium]
MTARELEEFKALRDTIRERGTARHWIVVVGLAVWAALALVVSSMPAAPLLTLVPLLMLLAVFEVVFTLHTGVERVGRYLQVFHERPDDAAAWEQVAMSYGRSFKGGGIDALFSPVFVSATIFNLVPLILAAPVPIEWAVVSMIHALVVARIWSARRQAGRQRATDLERFTQLKAAAGHLRA